MRLILLSLVVLSLQTAGTGSVRLLLSERGGHDVTAVRGTVYYEAPGVGRRELRVMSLKAPVTIEHLPPAVYRMTMVAESMTNALVASRVVEIEVTAGRSVDAPIDLVQRRGWVDVVDATGEPVPGAHFYTRPSAVNSSTDDLGRINLAVIAAGTEVTVRTIQWGVTCHRVTSATRQTIVIPDATDELVISAPSVPISGLAQRRHIVPALRLAGATITGVPGADCPVPYEHLPVTLARAGALTEHTLLLPAGEYVINFADGSTRAAQVPGRLLLR
jgi:hypothetical protein